MSLFGEYPCINQTIAPSYISFTSAAISVPMCLFTIAGNLLVVLAIFMDPNKDLKSPFNYFVANLAISDLVVGFVVDPLSFAYHLSEGVSRKYPAPLAYIHMPYFISCTASVLSLAALTVDRLWAITSPLTYRTKLNPKRAGFVAAGIWAFSLSFPFIYFVTGYLTYAFVFAHTVIIFTFLVMLTTYYKTFSRIEKSSETVGLDGSHERGQSGQETGGKMGTESDKDFYHYFGPLLSMLSTFLYFHLHHESLQCLQLYVYSLGQRFSFPFDTCQLRGEPLYLRLAI